MNHRNFVKRIVASRVHSGLCSLAVLLFVFISLPLFAQASLADFAVANKLYYENKFGDAAVAYERLIQSGRASAAVYFNLGNAWFKSGQLGRAIAAYRRAESLTPRDPDVRANLQFARNQAQGPTFIPNRWQLWVH